MLGAALAVTFASFAGLVSGKALSGYPHDYRGKPTGNYSESAKWQDYYEVHTARLPNVSFPLPRSFAGNIPVDRPNHPNNTLFFWGFERQNGSMTAKAGQRQDEPWGIWLNGGPGSSSLQGLLYENGPIHLNAKLHPVANKYSWNRLADFIWLDQPVGTGYSTCDENGFATNETQVADDFIGFLKNLVQVFPSLKTRPLYLTGESYAGTYIPYMTRALLSMSDPPVQLRKISIGDGAIGEKPQYKHYGVLSVMETYPQLIDYDVDVYNWFKQQHTLCGYNLNLTYPQTGGTFPTFDNPPKVGNNHKVTYVPNNLPSHRRAYSEDYDTELDEKRELFEEWLESTPANPIVNERDWMAGAASISFSKRALNIPWKRNLAGRANGTIDPCTLR